MFSLLFSFCICGAVFHAIWTRDHMPQQWYLMPSIPVDEQYNPENPKFVGFASFITSFILYGTSPACSVQPTQASYASLCCGIAATRPMHAFSALFNAALHAR